MKRIQVHLQITLAMLTGCFSSLTATPVVAAPQERPSAVRETRDFTILVDNRQTGTFRLTVTTGGDGRSIMTGQADVRVPYLLRSYVYTYRGAEIWNGDRPVQVQASTNDNGKKASVTAVVRDSGTDVTVNGERRAIPGLSWTTTYWRLPAPAVMRNQGFPILDVDTGKIWQGKLQFVGPVQVRVDGNQVNCSYYRLDTETPAELWFDGQGRLVRQVSVEEGHRTEWRLARIRQEGGN
jgi:hypothetical protein